MSEKGSITGIYSVLVDGDDHNEPIADAVRGILDGHVVLSRDLASKNHYPSIDVLQSVSRIMNDITDSEIQALASRIREHLAIYQDAKDLIDIGAYVEGSNPKIDEAIRYIDRIRNFLCQDIDENNSYENMLISMKKVFEGAETS